MPMPAALLRETIRSADSSEAMVAQSSTATLTALLAEEHFVGDWWAIVIVIAVAQSIPIGTLKPAGKNSARQG